ncbi:MAG: hypothetical protein NT023_00400, partial [Armatimonadetes bacterium]|nr:hypothetical protein [Armatimonadota bacterium]
MPDNGSFPFTRLIGLCILSDEIWEAYLYPPSFRPADTFLPNREKGLTYKQFCIAIHLFGCRSHTYPNELS